MCCTSLHCPIYGTALLAYMTIQCMLITTAKKIENNFTNKSSKRSPLALCHRWGEILNFSHGQKFIFLWESVWFIDIVKYFMKMILISRITDDCFINRNQCIQANYANNLSV